MSTDFKVNEVFVSIVTLPRLDYLEVGSNEFLRFKSTYTDYKEYLNDKQIVQSYYEDAGKSIAFCRVHQICIGFVNNDVVRVKVLIGEEENIIRDFHELLKSPSFVESKLYGFNNEFIKDILTFRGRVYKITSDQEARQFKDISEKPWNRKKSVCLMDELSSSYRSKISLLNALHGAGIDYSDMLDNSSLIDLYKSNKNSLIQQGGVAYIKGLVNIKYFLEGKSALKNTYSTIITSGKYEPKEIVLIDHLLASGEITSDMLDSLVKFTEKENLDRESVYLAVVAALSKTAPYNVVDKETKEQIRQALKLLPLVEVEKQKKEAEKKKEFEIYSKIECVVQKGNLGKNEANKLIKIYSEKSDKIKKEVVSLTEKFLTEKGKINQKLASNALRFLQDSLL